MHRANEGRREGRKEGRQSKTDADGEGDARAHVYLVENGEMKSGRR